MIPFLYYPLGAIALIALWLIATYNGLVRRNNRVKEAWADIEVQLKRRYDLVPNLVEIVKGYMAHERQVFENVTQARAAAMGAKSEKEKLQAENAFTQTLKTLFAVAENYPQLKANENFLELQRELTDTEDKIQAARRFYNSNVRDYNIAIQTFPTNMVAGAFGFKAHELFDIDEKGPEGQPVKVTF
jgi:LemA protein